MTTTANRPVRIFFQMEQGPVMFALRQVLGTLLDDSTQCEADGIDDADLIIFDDVRYVESTFRRDKRYAYVTVSPHKNPRLPANVTRLSAANTVVGVVEIISDVQKTMPAEPTRAEPKAPIAPIPRLPAARRILVVDDTEKHRNSAQRLLGGHDLTVCNGYQEAMTAMARSQYEIVLTDLHMPMSSRTMGDKFCLGELVPYGILIMLEAARTGATHIAIVTDINHHDDPFSAAFDHFSRFALSIENAKVQMWHTAFTEGHAKDWAYHLNEILKKAD